MCFCIFILHCISAGISSGACPPAPALSLTVSNYTPLDAHGSELIRVAADGLGTVYAASVFDGTVKVYDRNGAYVKDIAGFQRPVSVAAFSDKLYVGDMAAGSVSIVNSAGQITGSLGAGAGEFGLPSGITVDGAGNILVTDSPANSVKIYGSTGIFKAAFGSAGSGNGQFNFPTGIIYDPAFSEVYVVDHKNFRVQVFDSAGTFVRQFSVGYPSCQVRLQGIAVSNGKIYVSDAYQSTVWVYRRNGTYLTTVGAHGNLTGKLKLPMGIAMADMKLYVANTGNQRLEAYDVRDASALLITPDTLTFTTYFNANPAPQVVQISSEVTGAAVNWTASSTSPFVSSATLSGTTPSSAIITVNASPGGVPLVLGQHQGRVNFTSGGVDYSLNVTLNVLPPKLEVPTATVDLLHQRGASLGSPLLTSQVSVSETGGTEPLLFTATPDTACTWLTVSPDTGFTPASITIAGNSRVLLLADSTYTCTVTVTSQTPGVLGSPAQIPVRLRVITAGSVTVNSNIPESSFTLNGGTTYQGSGSAWSANDILPGTYTLTFDAVRGYYKPFSRTITVTSGQPVTVDAVYTPVKTANVLAVAAYSAATRKSTAKILDLDGVLLDSFDPGYAPSPVKLFMGDVNGDGFDEVLVTTTNFASGEPFLKVFSPGGTLLGSLAPVPLMKNGPNVIVNDLDGDGASEIGLSLIGQDGQPWLIVYTVDNSFNFIEKKRSALDISGNRSPVLNAPAAMAAAYTKENDRPSLIIAYGETIRLFTFDGSMNPVKQATRSVYAPLTGNRMKMKPVPTVSAVPVNNGLDKIVAGYVYNSVSYFQLLNADLSAFASPVPVFLTQTASPVISGMDWDGDSVGELLLSEGIHFNSGSMVKVLSNTGVELKELDGGDGRYGVSAVFGRINR